MTDLPKELYTLVGTALGVIGTLLLGLLKARREDHQTAAALRDELRQDNAALRERVEHLEALVQEFADERLVLKRALDRRDHEIEVLKRTVHELELRQARLEDVSEPT